MQEAVALYESAPTAEVPDHAGKVPTSPWDPEMPQEVPGDSEPIP